MKLTFIRIKVKLFLRNASFAFEGLRDSWLLKCETTRNYSKFLKVAAVDVIRESSKSVEKEIDKFLNEFKKLENDYFFQATELNIVNFANFYSLFQIKGKSSNKQIKQRAARE